ncbi:hypothetical protein ABS642_07025 [Microbacterium sp. A8/3-1]|uniref:Uncharacterized protein n=1 Tax=Microbacterium sp. A8/3-1 TaxID=3160749 RepID=A0AAU7W254_9MICO
MASTQARTLVAFIAVTLLAVGIGLFGAMRTPAAYGLTLTRANAIMDTRPWGWTVGWMLFAVGVLVVALWRASVLRRQGRPPVSTTIRGAVWLWGAIVGSWFLVRAVWDLQMADVLRLELKSGGLPIGGVYPLSGIVALLIAPVWSIVSRLTRGRSATVLGGEQTR